MSSWVVPHKAARWPWTSTSGRSCEFRLFLCGLCGFFRAVLWKACSKTVLVRICAAPAPPASPTRKGAAKPRNPKPQPPNLQPPTPNPEPRTPNPEPPTPNPQPPTPNPQPPNPKPQTPNLKPQTPNLKPPTLNPKLTLPPPIPLCNFPRLASELKLGGFVGSIGFMPTDSKGQRVPRGLPGGLGFRV